MTGHNGSQKSGLFSGFLSGTALCLCLGAGAAYISPLPSDQENLEPSMAASEQAPVAPKNVTTEIAVITPKSDAERASGVVPSNEAPIADRDDARISASADAASAPVQTGTPNIEAPAALETVDALTSTTQETVPKVPEVAPLETVEVAPEQNLADIDVSSDGTGSAAPKVETSDVAPVDTQESDITLALNAPKVQAPEETPQPIELDTSSADAVDTGAGVDSVNAPQATMPVVPKARPVIALNQPSTTAPKVSTGSAPLVQTPEPNVEIETSSAAPQSEDVAPELPQSEEPVDETPQVPDEAPEAPVVAPEAVEVEEDLAPDATTTQVTNNRNPPPPTFEGRAFDAFAVDFIPPNNKPFLTVVLEHVGEGSVDMYDLLNFGQPITFGVHSSEDLAPWRESEFRKAGFEVVVIAPQDEDTGLSEGMEADAVSERIDDYLVAVPGAVAVLDNFESDLYRDPRMVTQVSEELALTGRGLVFHEKFGVNRALEAARAKDVPAASLLRVIDEQRDAANIRRALDRAALDASKTGAAIVYGRTYPETLAALLPWLLGNSARSVTLAPLTSTMKRIVE